MGSAMIGHPFFRLYEPCLDDACLSETGRDPACRDPAGRDVTDYSHYTMHLGINGD